MAGIGIVGSGIAGLHLGLALQQDGIPATIYCERTPEQQLGRRLSNMVARNARTRERERRLGVNHWDEPSYDMRRLSLSIGGPQPLGFSGCFPSSPQAVDMRVYWARLLEDFSARGGRVVFRALQADDLDALATQHDLVVVASGRGNLAGIFPRLAEHSPFTSPQRLGVYGYYRGIAYPEPPALEVFVTPGSGEILAVPMQSFEPDLTAIGILITEGGLFEPLRHLRYDDDPRGFVATVLTLFQAHAPSIHARIDARRFDVSRPLDLGYVAITPAVRRGFAELPNGRPVVALGDAHVVMDPITGQGANNASHAAFVLARAIRKTAAFDRAFCEQVEREIAAFVVPVSDAANARLQPPSPSVRRFLGAAARDQALADMYADGYNHPDRFWAMVSSPERTAAVLNQSVAAGTAALRPA